MSGYQSNFDIRGLKEASLKYINFLKCYGSYLGVVYLSPRVQNFVNVLVIGNLTFKEMHEQLTLAFSVCLSKETVFERVNALFKLGEIVELEGHGQGALYSLLE